MPELVRGCHRQLRAHNDNVVLITKDNIRQYADIPQYIYDKVAAGCISFTHLSDILRASLLAQYGGLWVDSTCWLRGALPEEVYDWRLTTPRTKGLADMPSWSNSRWCGWGIGTNEAGNPLFVFLRGALYNFWAEHNQLPFYLLIDYLIDYAYRHDAAIRAMIDAVAENNTRRNDLHFMLNQPWDAARYAALCEGRNWLFKLSYKSLWRAATADGKSTFYGRLLCEENHG